MSRARTDAARARRLAQVAWIAVGIYLVALGVVAVLRVQGDFNVYYRAGIRVLNGEAIYRLDESSHFLYAPIFALVFAPFSALPIRLAQFAWYLVSAASLIALMIGSSRMLFGPARRLEAALIVVPVLLSARFIENNIEHGQINLPTLAMVVWAIVFAEQDRPAASGALLAPAILIKPFAALAGLFLLLEGKLRPMVFSIVFGIGLLLAPMLVWGPSRALTETEAYLRVVSSMTDRYTLMLTNQSASSAVARLMSLGAARGATPSHLAMYIGAAFELAMVAGVVIWFLRNPGGEPRVGTLPHRFELAALFCIIPSMVPISWKSYYAALLIPYLLLTYVLWTERPPNSPTPTLTLALVALSVVLNWIPGTRPNHYALFFSAHFFSSLALLVAVVTASSWTRHNTGGTLKRPHAVNGQAII